MKTLLALLAALCLLAASAQAQIKTLSYGTNGQVVYAGTNKLTFTNTVAFTGETEVQDLTVNGFILTAGEIEFGGTNAAANAAASRTNLGLANTNSVIFSNVTAVGGNLVGPLNTSIIQFFGSIQEQFDLSITKDGITSTNTTNSFVISNSTEINLDSALIKFGGETVSGGFAIRDMASPDDIIAFPNDTDPVVLNATYWDHAAVRTSLGLGASQTVTFGELVVREDTNLTSIRLSVDPVEVAFGAPIVFAFTNATENAATSRTNLGATTIGNAVFTATNAVAARQALGLQTYTLTLTNSVNDVEIGSTVSNVTVGWTIAPTNATYAVRTLIGAGQTNSITNNGSTLALTGLALTSNTTWTLTVGDGLGVTNTATTAVNFLNYMIWGRSTNTTLSNSNIETLHTTGGGASRAFATSRSRSFTMDGGANYIFIAYPEGFGAASFTVGGLPNTAFTLSTNSYTNASGYVTNYLIYRTDTIQNGTGINFVVQ
jgi:hypothetical protein